MSVPSEAVRPRVIPPDELLYSDEGSSIYSSDDEHRDNQDQKTVNETKHAITTVNDSKVNEATPKPKLPISKRQRRRNRRARNEARKAAVNRNGQADATAQKASLPEKKPSENPASAGGASTIQSGDEEAIQSQDEVPPTFKLIVKGYQNMKLYG